MITTPLIATPSPRHIADSIEERITQFELACKAWWKAADNYQCCGMYDDMKRCRLKAAGCSEMVAILRDQKASYWHATIAPDHA
jgi:hypothetical protein